MADIIFKARHTDVRERFRKHAAAKLTKIEKLDGKTTRIDVQITAERNPRQSDRRERVELTVTSRGPAIRAEAAAEDRFAAFDIALSKLESRLRRACDRRKGRHGAHAAVRLSDLPEADLASGAELPAIRLGHGGGLLAGNGSEAIAAMAAAAEVADAAAAAAAAAAGVATAGVAAAGVATEAAAEAGAAVQAGAAAEEGSAGIASAAGESAADDARDVPIEMQGDGPLVVREKFHVAAPMSIDQALFEMEMVGHDFFLFNDTSCGMPSVVYRRRGYQYGVIRLIEEHALGSAAGQDSGFDQALPAGLQQGANGRPGQQAQVAGS